MRRFVGALAIVVGSCLLWGTNPAGAQEAEPSADQVSASLLGGGLGRLATIFLGCALVGIAVVCIHRFATVAGDDS